MFDKLNIILQMLVVRLFLSTSLVHAQEQDQLPAPSKPWFHDNTLYWDEVEGADLYFAYRSWNQRVLISSIRDLSTQISYSDLEDGARYEFRVRSAISSDRSRDSRWCSSLNVRFHDSFCVMTNTGVYIGFPSSGFLLGITTQYSDEQCAVPSGRFPILNENGLAYSEAGFSIASGICTRANNDGTPYSAESTEIISDGNGWFCVPAKEWQCVSVWPDKYVIMPESRFLSPQIIIFYRDGSCREVGGRDGLEHEVAYAQDGQEAATVICNDATPDEMKYAVDGTGPGYDYSTGIWVCGTDPPTATPTATSTPTTTPTATATHTPTSTPTATDTPTPTPTMTPAPMQLPAPGNVRFISENTVAWDAVPGAVQYHVGWNPQGEGLTIITVSRSVTQFTDTDMSAGVTYEVKVRAMGDGEVYEITGDWSAILRLTLATATPTATDTPTPTPTVTNTPRPRPTDRPRPTKTNTPRPTNTRRPDPTTPPTITPCATNRYTGVETKTESEWNEDDCGVDERFYECTWWHNDCTNSPIPNRGDWSAQYFITPADSFADR